MRVVDDSVVSQSVVGDRSEIGLHDTYERDPQIRSVITPGLMSVPPVPAWLRRLFRRADAG